jgi:hypothetical protein
MARWQLMGPWSHAAVCIPASTEIVAVAGPTGELTVTYNHMPLTLPMPLDAKSMDDEAAALMRHWYPPEMWHRLLYGPDVGKAAPAQTTAADTPAPPPPGRKKRSV